MSDCTVAFTVGAAPAGAPLRFRDRVRARLGVADLLVFCVGDERFAIELQAVDETVESPAVSSVPERSRVLLGVIPHGGQFLPLYDTARVLEVRGPNDAVGAALVMRGAGRRIGLAVVDVEDVMKIELSQLREVPAGAWADDMVLGLHVDGQQVIAVLDARALVMACQAASVPDAL